MSSLGDDLPVFERFETSNGTFPNILQVAGRRRRSSPDSF